jgi:hypothetical protein
MNISVSDPLELLIYQNGLVQSPLEENSARGATDLDAKQRSCIIGTPIPIVFCRRQNNVGGVLVSPAATEGSYANDGTTNVLTVKLILVLSDGQLPTIQENHVFQRACREGTWNQSYDRRPSNWVPGNTTTVVSGKTPWNCPAFCGTSGRYEAMTTMSYVNTHADGDETWSKQTHVFVEQGIKVTRLIDSTLGPSDNFVDLAKYLITQSSRFPSSMLDDTEMLNAAKFTNANGFLYNGVFEKSTNLEDWLSDTGAAFLLRISQKNGKKFLRPRLPHNTDGTIKTTAITESFGFTEEHILDGGFEISYVPLVERRDICAQVLWRQQPDNDIGLIRTSEVRFSGTAANGPFEQYDLSEFVCGENHAVKVGTYHIARRKYITHTLRIKVRPSVFGSTLTVGDIVRVKLRRETGLDDIEFHDYLYEVERISKSLSGVVELDLTHFPIDSDGKSLIALAVNTAAGSGFTMPTGKASFSCDVNSGTGDLSDTGMNYADYPGDFTVPSFGQVSYQPSAFDDLGGSAPNHPIDNPDDPFDGNAGTLTDDRTSAGDPLTTGDALTAGTSCAGGKVHWYRRNKETGAREHIKSEGGDGTSDSFSYSLTTADMDHYIEAYKECPDPSSPSGFGGEEFIGETSAVEPATSSYTHARLAYTKTKTNTVYSPGSTTGTSDWVAISSSDTLALAPAYGTPGISCTHLDGVASSSFKYPNPAYQPWRSSVKLIQHAFLCSGGSITIGGISKNENSCPKDEEPNLTANCQSGYTGDPPLSASWEITGKWEFSTDGTNPVQDGGSNLQWSGRLYEDGDSYT